MNAQKMHPAKALEAAVFALAAARDGRTANIRGTNLVIYMRGSWYYITDGATMYAPLNRQRAIDKIEEILTA